MIPQKDLLIIFVEILALVLIMCYILLVRSIIGFIERLKQGGKDDEKRQARDSRVQHE